MFLHTAVKSPVKGILTAIYTGSCACCAELYAYVEHHPSTSLELDLLHVKQGNCLECDEGIMYYPDPY